MKGKYILSSFLIAVIFTSCANISDLSKFMPKKKKKNFQYSALHTAVMLNNIKSVKKLANSSNVNIKDNFNDTPIIDAVRNNYTDISKVLICTGANTKVKDMNNKSLLYMATMNNNQELINIFTTNNPKLICNKMSIDNSKVIVKKEKDDKDLYLKSMIIPQVTIPKKVIVKNNVIKNKTKAKNLIDVSEITAINNEPNINNTLLENNNIEEVLLDKKRITLTTISQKNEIISKLEKIRINNIEFNKNDLSFTFIKQYKLNKELKSNLAIFMPQLLNTIKDFKNNIKSIRVENYTSLEYSSKQSEYDKFLANEKLSKKRANDINSYILLLSKAFNLDSKYVQNNFKAFGMSSLNLIKNKFGEEDIEKSKRTIIKIVLK